MLNQVKTLFLLGVLSAIIVSIGGLFGPTTLYIAVGMALLMNVGAYFYSDKMVLKMHGAQVVDERQAPDLHRMVGELAERAGIPKPKIAVIPDPQPNAFATGRNPEHGVVAVTQGIMQALSPRELRGVLAHEIAHIQNRDILVASVAAAMATAVSTVANMAQWSLMFGGMRGDDDDDGMGGYGALVMMFVAPIAATLVQLGISRSREFLADQTGAHLSGDAHSLADALLKLERGAAYLPSQASPATASLFIVNPFAGMRRGFSQWFSTHPATADRVARLRAMA